MSKYIHNSTKLLILSGVLAGALVFSPVLSSLALAEGTEVTEATATTATTATNDSLRVSRSLLASTTRIERIATQNYGMTLETNRPVVDVNNNA